MSSLPLQELENSPGFGYNYEDPKAFKPYYLLLIGLDFVFNWIIDWAHTDPLAILVIFVFQCLGLIVNLIVYVMASGSQAMQTGLRKSLIYHHQVHLITSLLYICLTCSWYVWALRKSWPSVSDQFSFSFGPEIIPTVATTTTATTIVANFTTTTTTIIPPNGTDGDMNMKNMTKSIRSFSFITNLFPNSRGSRKVNEMISANENNSTSSIREFYTLWSPGFVAVYTIQRTVAIIYYFVSMKAAFLVLNASTIDSFDEKINSPGNNTGRGAIEGRRISWDENNEKNELEQISTDTNPDLEGRLKRLRNFVNNPAQRQEQGVSKMGVSVSNILEMRRTTTSKKLDN